MTGAGRANFSLFVIMYNDNNDDGGGGGGGGLAHGWTPPRGGERTQRDYCPQGHSQG